MYIEGAWISWKEQCSYCLNRHDCEMRPKVKEYISNLCAVDNSGISGSLNWKCKELVFDSLKYNKEYYEMSKNLWKIEII